MAKYISTRYSIVEVFDDQYTGFSALLLRNTYTGEYVLTIRGTEFENDKVQDLYYTDLMIGTHSLAIPQVVSLQMALDQIKRENLTGSASIDVTGHSLGGHLALIAKALDPERVDEAHIFNAPQISPTIELTSANYMLNPILWHATYESILSTSALYADVDLWPAH